MKIINKYIKKIINDPLMFLSVCLERMPGSRFLKSLMPDSIYLMHIYRLCIGCELNLKHPKTFSEKLQWLKLYNRRPEYITMVDKYAVKDYVANKIGEEYIIPTLGVWDKVEDIIWDSLPNQFVLKCTHDSGGLIICKDKSSLNIKEAEQKLRKSLCHNYYLNGREWPYKGVRRRIIAEKFLVPQKPEVPSELLDYKFFCFNGKVKFFKVDFGRFVDHHANYYSPEGELLDFGEMAFEPDPNSPVELPDNLDKMIVLAEQLSKDIPFVRVDFYNTNGRIYFGELTFYPASGFGKWTSPDIDQKLGDLLVLF